MSNSFVKDCSDVSAPRNSSSGKTVIIIVNETGNISLDQDELQNLLASHGADESQVSVVRMGSGGVLGSVNEIITHPSIVTAPDGTAHVNLSIEGYPTIPIEGAVGGGINYAELPLDQDAFQRLESVLDSEEAREILGEPLLNMVTNPDQLGTFDQLMDSSLFEGADQVDGSTAENQSTEGSPSKKSRSPPKRRSQRQMDKAEREEVEKILAENQKLLQEEKQQLNEQVLERMRQMSTSEGKEEEEEEEEDDDDEETDENDGDDDGEGEKDKTKNAVNEKKGRKGKSEEVTDKPKGRGRGRGRGKGVSEKGSLQEIKGRGKGKKKMEEEESETTSVGRGRSRGSGREEMVGVVKGRGRGNLKNEKETGVGKKKVVIISDGKMQKEDKKVDKQVEKEARGNKKSSKECSDDLEDQLKNIVNFRGSDSESDNTKKVKFKKKENEEEGGKRIIVRRVQREKNAEELDSEETHGNAKRTVKRVSKMEGDGMNVDDEDDDIHTEDEEIVAGFNMSSKGLQIKSLKVAVDKVNIQQALEKEMAGEEDDLPSKKNSGTPKLASGFNPAVSSTPRVNVEGKGNLHRAIIMKGGKIIKSHKIIVGDKSKQKKEESNNEKNKENDKERKPSQTEVFRIRTKPQLVEMEAKNKVMVKQMVAVSSKARTEKDESEMSSVENERETPSRKINIAEGKSKLIQVRSPTGIRQVVVLNAAKSTQSKETLVKVIDPIDPPREEDRLSVAKLCANAKKEAAQKKKLELQKRKNGDMDVDEEDMREGEGKQGSMMKSKGKMEKKDAGPKIVDLKMDLEDPYLIKKREAKRKREEIQRMRNEILRKREAIKLRKEQQMKESQLKREGSREDNSEFVKQETKSDKTSPKLKEQASQRNPCSENLRRSNSQETPVKREMKVIIQPKTPSLKSEPGEITPKIKTQGILLKNPLSTGTPKGKVKVFLPKNPDSVKKNINREEMAQNQPKKVMVKKPDLACKKENLVMRKLEEKFTSQMEDSPIRRSGRAVKKKNFGDEMLTFDLKEEAAPDEEEAENSEVEGVEKVVSDAEEEEDDDDDYDDYDDPDRLWCICQKPHNNRFMICCDRCEDWFHGSCVGITKAMGQQMEDRGQEWVCPKCKKADKAMKEITFTKKIDTLPRASEMSTPSTPALQKIKTLKSMDVKRVESNNKNIPTSQQVSKKIIIGIKKADTLSSKTSIDEKDLEELPSFASTSSTPTPSRNSAEREKKCAIEWCKRTAKGDSVYCSNECVLKHAQMSLKLLGKTDKDLEEHQIPEVSVSSLKSEPRVLVYEKNSGKILSGSEAPSLREVKTWLKEHPDYAVLQPGMMRASGSVVTGVKPDANAAVAATIGKKVIKLNTQGAVPTLRATPEKVTVVKSADGRIIVKTSEALSKGIINKITPTTTVNTGTKTVLVNSLKSPVVVGKPIVESRVSGSDMRESDFSSRDPTNSLKKNNDSMQLKKNLEMTPVRKNSEGIIVRKVEPFYSKASESPEVVPLESPTPKTPDSTGKVSSPLKDPKKMSSKPAASDPSIVRGSIRKTLADCLTKRSKEATPEFESMSEDQISELAGEIEKELYLFFGKDVGFKYKSRYRSLLFNIRDTKNSGLFRKILNGTIAPASLAKMTSEELASKELAEWREREEKKELQAIEKHELDMMKLGNQYIMKSHKGEIEIDKDEFIKDKEKAPETIMPLPTDPVLDCMEDTTAYHKNHMYDLNCRICTGQEPAPLTQDLKYKGKQNKKGYKDGKKSDTPRDRKDRKSSSDKDRERHRHKSKDYVKDKKHKSDRSKEKDKEGTRGRSKSMDERGSDREKDKYKDKHKSRRESERERDRSNEKKERRDSEKDDKDRRHKHKKDRRESKEDKDKKRRDSERDDKKRKHSESRNEDRKRRESDKSRQGETDFDLEKMEREKAVVSTSDDVVFDITRLRRESFSHLDADAKDSVPTSTVIGSPDIIELKDDSYTSSYENKNLGSPCLFSSVKLRLVDLTEPNPPLPPGREVPAPPPLPDSPPPPLTSDITTPPLSYSPGTPPLPDSMVYSPKTPSLPDDICLSPLAVDDIIDDDEDDDDFPVTPPLPDDDDIPKMSVHTSSLEDAERLTPPLERGPGSGSSPVLGGKLGEPVIVWKGIIHMADISKFYASAFEVSGKSRFLPEDVPKEVDVVGRISPDTVWSYIAQTKKAGTKEILVVRFQPSNEEEKVSYIALYSYLSSKKRYGVIGNCEKAVKDFYVVPLASHQPIPQVLLPLDGPGFEEHRAHMLIGVIVRAKSRRIYDHITGTWQIVGPSTGSQNKPIPLFRPSNDEPERSYTPPLPTDQDIDEIALAATDSSDDDSKYDEGSMTPPMSKRRRDDDGDAYRPKKRPSLDERLRVVADSILGSKSLRESSFEGVLDQESMLAELNRQIEVHKKELSEMQKTVQNEDDEPYSPSRPDHDDTPEDEPLKLDTSKINIPSNLQEILNNIKKKEEEIKNKELEIKRRLSLAADPIVMTYGKYEDTESKTTKGEKRDKHGDVDLRPMLRAKTERTEAKKDEDMRTLQAKDTKEVSSSSTDTFPKNDDTDLRVRDPRLARAHAAAVMEAIETGKSLRNLTDEELLAKAMEMEMETCAAESNNKSRLNADLEQPSYEPVPPPPFMAGGFMPQSGPIPPTAPMSCPPPMGMVGTPFMNQMGPPPPQPVGMYGPPNGRNQGIQGPPNMPGPPGVHEPPGPLVPHRMPNHDTMGPGPCPPPMLDGPRLQDCDPCVLEPPQRYPESSSRYQEDWKRNYGDRGDRAWEYNNYSRYPDDNANRHRDRSNYRDRERDRDWHRRPDHDDSYLSHPYNRRNKQFDKRDDARGGGSGGRGGGSSSSSFDSNQDRNRDRFNDGNKHKKKRNYHEKNKSKDWGKFDMHRKSKNYSTSKDDKKSPPDDEDDEYEIDY